MNKYNYHQSGIRIFQLKVLWSVLLYNTGIKHALRTMGQSSVSITGYDFRNSSPG